MSPETDLLLSVKRQLKQIGVPVYDFGEQVPNKFPQIVVNLMNEQELNDLRQMDYMKVSLMVDVYTKRNLMGRAYDVAHNVRVVMQTVATTYWPIRYDTFSERTMTDTTQGGDKLLRINYIFDYFVYGKKGV